MELRSNTQEFIQKANQIHNFEYDYSKVNYINNCTKVTIICKIHGEFEQRPNGHLSQKNKCPQCQGLARSSTSEFINRSKLIHNDFFDYSKVEYVNNITKVIIICPIHGEFEQRPNGHLSGQGCFNCQCDKSSKSTTEFIKDANRIHNFRYDYSKSEYFQSKTRVTIICKEHGEFEQTPSNHLMGEGCPTCSHILYYLTLAKKNVDDCDNECILYLINIFDEYEDFYKIGITLGTAERRFQRSRLPYNFKLIKSVKNKINYIVAKEQEILKRFSHLKYKPKLEFNGMTECFTKEILNHL